MKSDTPETDAELNRLPDLGYDIYKREDALAEFARKLERENAQLRADLLVAQKLDKERFQHNCELISENQELRAELVNVKVDIQSALLITERIGYLSPEKAKKLQEDNARLIHGLMVTLKYPRGSEAQVRCLEEVAGDFEREIKALAHAEQSGLA